MLAMLFATIAFSTSAMLPAIADIAVEMTPGDTNRAQIVVTSFMLGMGIGSFFVGPISDMFGRKTVVIAGLVIYAIAALYASGVTDIEYLLASRFAMGIGASSSRVVTLAMVRDLYAGREMARIMSFVMTVFVLVPAVAPSIGALIIAFSSWRGVFLGFVVFAIVSGSWLGIRQPETLPKERRRPLTLRSMRHAFGEVLGKRIVLIYVASLSFVFAQMMAFLSTLPQVFDETYGRADSFPLWFAVLASFTAISGFVNSRLVMTLGMHRLASSALFVQFAAAVIASGVLTSAVIGGDDAFYVLITYMSVSFFMIGLTIGNMNALAMEPLGHVAGYAAAIISGISTIVAVLKRFPMRT